jgi:hypothetical protein
LSPRGLINQRTRYEFDFKETRMKTKITAGILAMTLALGTVAVSSGDASAQRWGGRHGGWGHHGGGWGHGGWGHRGGWGVGAGLAAGAIIGGALASRPYYGGYGAGYYDDPGYYAAVPGGGNDAYCAQRFKSYDPASGTYLGYDGVRHPCP